MKKQFLETHRPREWDGFVGNTKIKKNVMGAIENESLLNYIFAGEAGIGKTSLAQLIGRKVLGDFYGQDYIELNGSTDNRIEIIRNKIGEIIKRKPFGFIRIIVFDEAERLTKAAQAGLKRLIEKGKNTIWIFITNDLSKINKPIKSRCKSYNFEKIRPNEMVERLKYIAKKENINISIGLLRKLCNLSDGDIRKPINTLQEVSIFDREITEEDIGTSEYSDKIRKIFIAIKKGEFGFAREDVYDLYLQGINFTSILNLMHDYILLKVNNKQIKIEMLMIIGECEYHYHTGCSEYLQISYLLSKLIKLVNKRKGSD